MWYYYYHRNCKGSVTLKKNEFSFLDILSMISRHISIIIILVVIFASGAFVKSKFLSAPVYSAKGSIYISNVSKGQNNENGMQSEVTLNELMTSQELIKSYIQILCTDRFFNRVKTVSNLKYPVSVLKSMVTLEAQNQTEILNISAVAPSPHDAYILVESIIALAKDEIEWVVEGGSLKTLDYPAYSSAPLSSGTMMNTIIASVIGFILALVIIFIIEMLDTRIKGRDDLLSEYDIYILGEIPSFDIETEE